MVRLSRQDFLIRIGMAKVFDNDAHPECLSLLGYSHR